ncbi:MAG: UbiA family prenyltransferase [Chitinophagaceae bacterium]|nr:UbiA family prenyltransferase [Chitinophagaceae bacterium]
MNKTAPQYHPISSFSFWKAYFIHMRPYLLFISGIAGAAGIAMSRTPDIPAWKLCIAFIPFFLGYGFGQALTDCFQTDTDRISAPYRPLSQGIVSVMSVMMVSIAGLLLSGLLLLWLHPFSFLFSVVSVGGLATYSFVKKRYWFGGPFYNAWIVALLPAMGYFTGLPGNVWKFPGYGYPILIISFFSYANFVLIGYLKDIEADRATNYKTFPVVFGWRKTIFAGDVFMLPALFFFWWTSSHGYPQLLFGIAGSVVMIAGQIIAHLAKKQDEQEALIPILATVRGFILLHLAIVLRYQADWLVYAIIYYLLFEWALYNRPSKYQV